MCRDLCHSDFPLAGPYGRRPATLHILCCNALIEKHR
jgi:hypothetical protein